MSIFCSSNPVSSQLSEPWPDPSLQHWGCVYGGVQNTVFSGDKVGRGSRIHLSLKMTEVQDKPKRIQVPLLGLEVPAREARGQLTPSCPCSEIWPLPTTTSH